MDLVQRLTTDLGVDQRKAELILGMMFTAVRISVDSPTYEKIKQALPHVESWMGKSLVGGGGRTGEMLGLVGPEALQRNLNSTGLSDAQLRQAGSLVASALREALPGEALNTLATKVPLLKGA